MKTNRFTIQTTVLVLIAVSLGSARAEDRRSDPASLTVMTFNAQFLWDGVQPEEGGADFPWKNSRTEAEEHMAKIAEIIIGSNPDIINLVEVENDHALRTLNDKFLAGRGYRSYFVQGKDGATGQDVVLLTRIDPDTVPIERDERKGRSGTVAKSVSKHYIAKIQVGDRKIALIGVHLLAIPTMVDRKAQREAQADAIRGIASDLGEHLPIVLGDFNDYESAPESKDHIDSTPITTVLQRVRELDPNDPADDLKNAASFVPKDNRDTAFYDANRNGRVDPPREFTSIDHILISPALVPFIDSVDIPHHHDPRLVSDHFPVVVRFTFSTGTRTLPRGPRPRIESLLPNPPGDDSANEKATIVNLGNQTVSLAGWKLRDLARQSWTLDSLSTLAPGESKTITRNGQPMALNNNGDQIDLIDPSGNVVHTVSYGPIDEDEPVTPANN